MSRLRTALPPFVLSAAFLAMLGFSWGKWPDVLVDFGHELYVAWQISEGKALVQDFFYSSTGPLSPYLNALLFKVFGPSLRVLVALNLALLIALTWVLFRLLDAYAGRLAATAGALSMLVLFAFGQYSRFGNYNYVTPYSHGATHGLLLSLLCLWLAYRHLTRGGIGSLAGASVCLGAVFLTKPEIFTACAAGLLPVIAPVLRRALRERRADRVAIAALGPAILAPCLAFLALSLQLPPGLALRATVLPWVLLGTGGTQIPFYAWGLGIDHPGENILLLARWTGWYALVLVPAALLDLRLANRAGLRRWAPPVAFAAVATAIFAFAEPMDLYEAGRPLTLLALAGTAGHLALLRRVPAGDPAAPRFALGAMLWLFSLGMLLKMALNARIYHYGFALAMPAFAMLVATLAGTLPAWLRRRGGAGTVFQAVAAALLVCLSAAFLAIAAGFFREKTFRVGEGADAFLADSRGEFVSAMVRTLGERIEPGATLAVLPEGVMVNYLARRVNPTPFIEYMPDTLAWAGGEGPILDALRASPPDLILLVDRDTTEHGATYFGRDYALATMAWINANYTPVALVGSPPLQDGRYGMQLLSRTGADAPRRPGG